MEAWGGRAVCPRHLRGPAEQHKAEPVAFLWGLWAWAYLHGGYK